MLSVGFAFDDAYARVEQAVQAMLVDGEYYEDGYRFVFRIEDRRIVKNNSYRVRVALREYQPFDISVSEDLEYCYLWVYPVRFAREPLPVYPEEIADIIYSCTGVTESGYNATASADKYVLVYKASEKKKVLSKVLDILERVNNYLESSVQLRFESVEGSLCVFVSHKL